MKETAEKENHTKTLALLDLLRLIRRELRFIAVTCFVVVAVGGIYVFSLPRSYKARVALAPEISSATNGLSGNLGSLAAMAGVKLGGSTEDAIYPELYPKVVSTPDFLVGLLGEKVLPKNAKDSITLWTYLTEKQQLPWWGRLLSFGEKEKIDDRLNAYRLNKKQEAVVRALAGAIFCGVDKSTNVITIEAEMQDPEVAAQICDQTRTRLQSYITAYRTNKARNDLAYMEKITKESKDEYLAAQREYADFSDANKDLVLTVYQQEGERLENEMQLAYNVYSQSAQQLQLAKAKVQERTPAFTTVQPASVPLKPSAPKRMVTMAVLAVLAFFGSVAWLLLRDSYSKHLSPSNAKHVEKAAQAE